jgi:cold shock protein
LVLFGKTGLIRFIYALIVVNMKTGTVKFFNEAKGFGFIKDTASNEEYFVHSTGLIDKIKENDAVTFELAEGRRGTNAVNVKKA